MAKDCFKLVVEGLFVALHCSLFPSRDLYLGHISPLVNGTCELRWECRSNRTLRPLATHAVVEQAFNLAEKLVFWQSAVEEC